MFFAIFMAIWGRFALPLCCSELAEASLELASLDISPADATETAAQTPASSAPLRKTLVCTGLLMERLRLS